MKAKGAARYGVATLKTAEYLKHLSPALAQHALSLPDAGAFQGGAPIYMRSELLGGSEYPAVQASRMRRSL
jgi:hypothetical protein